MSSSNKKSWVARTDRNQMSNSTSRSAGIARRMFIAVLPLRGRCTVSNDPLCQKLTNEKNGRLLGLRKNGWEFGIGMKYKQVAQPVH